MMTTAPKISRGVSCSRPRKNKALQRIVSSGLHATSGSTRTTLPRLSAEKNERIAPIFTRAAAKSHAVPRRSNLRALCPLRKPTISRKKKKAERTVPAAARRGSGTPTRPRWRRPEEGGGGKERGASGG